MTSTIVHYGARKLLQQNLGQNKNRKVAAKDDPFFEIVVIDGKKRKVNRQVAAFVPEHDTEVLVKAKIKANKMDTYFFGRFGFDAIIGFILPEIGDVICLIMAMRLINLCAQIEGGLPKRLRARMMSNVMVDFGVGLIPFVGDIADTFFKCNTKNVLLLENYLIDRHGPKGSKAKRRSAGLELFAADKGGAGSRPLFTEGRPADIRPVTHDWEADDGLEEGPQGEHEMAPPPVPPKSTKKSGWW